MTPPIISSVSSTSTSMIPLSHRGRRTTCTLPLRISNRPRRTPARLASCWAGRHPPPAAAIDDRTVPSRSGARLAATPGRVPVSPLRRRSGPVVGGPQPPPAAARARTLPLPTITRPTQTTTTSPMPGWTVMPPEVQKGAAPRRRRACFVVCLLLGRPRRTRIMTTTTTMMVRAMTPAAPVRRIGPRMVSVTPRRLVPISLVPS
mmetsp:Transcript_8964/g.18300  ORF Transcript_8964/g.18300 Transcript_8964/m.18300 type:complete len:204 (+) Transcript_8964:16-627(+)